MRIDTPTYREWADGTKAWGWLGGGFHRLDGPAIEHSDGNLSWYLDGILYPFDQFLEQTTCSPEDKFMLKLRYG